MWEKLDRRSPLVLQTGSRDTKCADQNSPGANEQVEHPLVSQSRLRMSWRLGTCSPSILNRFVGLPCLLPIRAPLLFYYWANFRGGGGTPASGNTPSTARCHCWGGGLP